jgi:hypothetical protein
MATSSDLNMTHQFIDEMQIDQLTSASEILYHQTLTISHTTHELFPSSIFVLPMRCAVASRAAHYATTMNRCSCSGIGRHRRPQTCISDNDNCRPCARLRWAGRNVCRNNDSSATDAVATDEKTQTDMMERGRDTRPHVCAETYVGIMTPNLS